ncbi:hypothetical protein [Natrononativus amylolyticus]|uniref:hypothetical protein n=1 Tax=Natrononativus amylolyticus TaxID=2963434 RepID=UPI0020CD4E04|nr:hypothetical protein [Natrononativus amylolyticus]
MTTELAHPDDADWRVVGTRTDSSRIALATVRAETTLYEHVPSADSLEAVQPPEIDVPLRSLFAIELSFSPSLSAVGISPDAGIDLAAPKAKSQFVATLEDEGLDVGEQKRVGRLSREDGTEGRWYVLETAYPVAAGAADEGERPTVAAETHVAVWPTAESFAVAGGVLPLEAPPALESGLEVDVERDQQRLLDVVRALEIGERSEDESADVGDAGPGEDDTAAGDGA